VFFDSNLDLAAPTASLRPRFARPVNQVTLRTRNRRVIAINGDSFPRFGNANFQAIVQRDRLVNGTDFVVVIGPFAENF
jgi:hypothetical protein